MGTIETLFKGNNNLIIRTSRGTLGITRNGYGWFGIVVHDKNDDFVFNNSSVQLKDIMFIYRKILKKVGK